MKQIKRMNYKRILVDLSFTIPHHGHIRILKKASKFGKVIVALTSDEEVKKIKGYIPELNFQNRKEILNSITYVDKVVKSKWMIDDDFIKKYKIDFLVHGPDNRNKVNKNKLKIIDKTKYISSTILRKRAYKNYLKLNDI